MEKSSTTPYQSALTVVVFLLIIWLISGSLLFAKIATGVGFLSLLSKHIARWIDIAWSKVLMTLGWINSRILLSAVFFIILAPIAFLYRLVKGDTLNLKSGKSSYFVERDHLYTPDDMKNPW